MIAVLQRATRASVRVEGRTVGEIGHGLLILLGVAREDTEREAERIADKICGLRVFEDENGKMNLSVKDVGKEILLVSQFTLYGDTSKGNRPSFATAERPDRANELYLYTAKLLREAGVPVQLGVFGADMQISQRNDGPVTILLDSGERKNK